MKACVLHAKGDVRYEDVPEPTIRCEDEVKVKILSGGICGSDQHYFLEGGIGSSIVVREPIILGHEGCGIVEEVGNNVNHINVGDKVAIRPARPCFECDYCKKGQYSFCLNMKHLGSAATFPHTQGLFAEKVVIHKEQCRVFSRMSPEIAAFAEPLSVAFNGVHCLDDVIGKDVLVMGAGPIGCLCIAAAKTLGANTVIAIDVRENVLNIAKEMGADIVCNSKENPEQIIEWSQNKGFFDCAIEATGNGTACEQTMKMVRPEGVISQVGMFGTGNQPKDLSAFMTKGLKWNSVFRFYKEFGPSVNALEKGMINPLPLLSLSVPASEINEAMAAAISPLNMKVQVRF